MVEAHLVLPVPLCANGPAQGELGDEVEEHGPVLPGIDPPPALRVLPLLGEVLAGGVAVRTMPRLVLDADARALVV